MAEAESAADAVAAVPDSVWKIIRDVGPMGGTTIVIAIFLAATFFKWADVLRQWAKDRAENRLAWAKWEREKQDRDAAAIRHGALTQEAIHNLMGITPKSGKTGVDDHG